MGKLFAIVSLAYKESIRKKIFLVIIIFTFLLVILSSFMPVVKSVDRIRLIEIWSLQGISFLGVLMAIFLAAVSLPDDIELKRLLLILPKPISRETLLLGKLMGFALTLGIFVLIMGIVSLFYLYIVAGLSGTLKTLQVNQQIKPAEMYFQNVEPDKPNELNQSDKISGSYQPKEGVSVRIEGNKNNFVAWRFQDLNKSAPPTQARICLMLGEGLKISSSVNIRFLNPTTKEEFTKELHLNYKQAEVIEFPHDLIDPTGALKIFVNRVNPESYVTATPDSILLMSTPDNFAWNYIKAMALIWLQIIIVLAFCIAGSTLLSAGINVFLNIVIYMVGSGVRFWESSLEMMKKAMEQVIKTRAQELAQALPQAAPQGDAMPLWLMQTSDFIVRFVLKIFPDFSRYDGSEYLINGQTISLGLFPGLLGYLLIFVLASFIIGVVAFRLRDVN
ncbi:MAG: ABC transporter permease [Candidatus Brocadiia bacterium]